MFRYSKQNYVCFIVLPAVSYIYPFPTGAQNDLEKVTKMAYAQVGIYGMSPKIGLVSFPQEENSFNRPYSEATARMIDEEVRSVVDVAYQRTLDLVNEKSDLIKTMAEELLSKEVSFAERDGQA